MLCSRFYNRQAASTLPSGNASGTTLCSRSLKLLCVLIIFSTTLAFAEDRNDHPTAINSEQSYAEHYVLEDLRTQGSHRLSDTQILNELGLHIGQTISLDTLQSVQLNLLALGLFKSVVLRLEKGKTRGHIRLILELEDDPNVLGPWAIASLLSVTHDSPSTPTLDREPVPVSLTYQLLARNLLQRMHRASLMLDLDPNGIIQRMELAYGLPRFTKERTQFDSSLQLVQPSTRYLDILGFGAKAQASWTSDLNQRTQLQYGLAFYSNREPRFILPGFPELVAGPQMRLRRETRLLGFLPSAGHLIEVSGLLPIGEREQVSIELQAAYTSRLRHNLASTMDLSLLQSGPKAWASRLAWKTHWQFLSSRDDQALFFIQLRHGYDKLDTISVYGTEALIGWRYHSQGFIAEFGFKVTDFPKNFDELIDREELF